LLLAVLLLATPAWAAVRIVVEPDGEAAAIKYATDGEKVRAFALDITVDKGTIDGISDFIRGESTAANPGYGIFPANFGRYIVVDADTGEVASWDIDDYTPVADPCDRGALGSGDQRHYRRDGCSVLSHRRQFAECPAQRRSAVQAHGQRAREHDRRPQ
jgi:hypothetical protein